MKRILVAMSLAHVSLALAQGSPTVNESTGDLSYAYSFELPKARGRHQPTLSLVYSSAANQDLGFGHGWTLATPYIEKDMRAAPGRERIWASVGGERKLLVPFGGAYRPDVEDSFFEVTAVSGSDGTRYSARDASGSTYAFDRLFGNRAFLTSVIDLDGNRTEYGYDVDKETPTTIRYNQLPNSSSFATSIVLEYTAALPPGLAKVAAGGPVGATSFAVDRRWRLSAVKVKGAAHVGLGTVIRTYSLAYSPEDDYPVALVNVAEYGGDPAAGTPAPPPLATSFAYTKAAYGLSEPTAVGAIAMSAVPGRLDSGLKYGRWVDLDGDGLTDLVWPDVPAWAPNLTSPGSEAPVFGPAVLVAIPAAPSATLTSDIIDFDGDGVQDLVRAWRASGRAKHSVNRGLRLGHGSFAFDSRRIDIDVEQFFGGNNAYSNVPAVQPISLDYLLTDLNGDGVLDYATGTRPLSCGKDGPGGAGAANCTWSYGFTSFDPSSGSAAVIPQSRVNDVLPGASWFQTLLGIDWPALDVNADGLTDAVWIDGTQWRVALNLGTPPAGGGIVMSRDPGATGPGGRVDLGGAPFGGYPNVQVTSTTFPEYCGTRGFEDRGLSLGDTVDFDGDGRPDSFQGTWSYGVGAIWRNTTRGFGSPTPLANAPEWARFGDTTLFEWTWSGMIYGEYGTLDCEAVAVRPGHGQFTDLTGDGIPDFIRPLSATPPSPLEFSLGENGLGLHRPLVLSSVTVPEGAVHSVEYVPSSVFGAPGRFRKPVVVRLSVSGPWIPPASTRYWYREPVSGTAWYDPTKLDDRGFRSSWAQDETSGMVRQTTWATRAPLTGRASIANTGRAAAGAPASPSSPGVPPTIGAASSGTTLQYELKRLGATVCTGGTGGDASASAYPLRIIPSSAQTSAYYGSTAAWTTTTIACADVDANGNILKTTTTTGLGNTAGPALVTRQSFSGTTACPNVPQTLTVWRETSGTPPIKMTEESKTFDAQCRLIEQWSPGTSTAKTNRATFTYAAPFYQQDSSTSGGVTKRTVYDSALALYVVQERTEDAVAALTTTYTYDQATGFRLSASGPVATKSGATPQAAITRYYVYDLFGRTVAVSKLGPDVSASDPRTAAFVPRALQVNEAVEYTEYVDAPPQNVPRSVLSYRFAVPRSFSLVESRLSAIDAVDTMLARAYRDSLGRVIQVRERLGGTLAKASGARVADNHHLIGVKVSKAVVLDASGREVVSAEPFYDGAERFEDYATTGFPGQGTRARVTIYDDERPGVSRPQGTPWCVSLQFVQGQPVREPGGLCQSNSVHGQAFRLATETNTTVRTVAGRGPYSGQFLATEVIPPDQNEAGGLRQPRVALAGPSGEELGSVDADGNYTWITRDAAGREVGSWRERIASPAASTPNPVSSIRYNFAGQVIETWDGNYGTVLRQSQYDEAGRLVYVTLDPATREGFEYLFEPGGIGRVTRVNQVTYPSGSAVRKLIAQNGYDFPLLSSELGYSYVAGKLAWTTNKDPANPGDLTTTQIAYGYDDAGRVFRRDQWFTRLDGTKRFTVSSDYGADGRVRESRVVNEFDATKTYLYNVDYDSSGRPVMLKGNYLSAPSQTTVYEAVAQGLTGAYDATGRVPVMKADAGNVVSARLYDAFSGALTGECKRFGSEINCTGTSLSSPADIYRTDKAIAEYQGGKLKSYRESFPSSATNYVTTYLPSGRVLQTTATPDPTTGAGAGTLSQDWSEKFTYNGIGNLESAEVKRNATLTSGRTLVDTKETYTPEGSSTSLLDKVVSIGATATSGKTRSSTTYAYDLLGRLVEVKRSAGESETLYYAPGGEVSSRQIGDRFVFYVGEYATVTARGAAGCATNPSTCVPQAATVEVDAHVVFAGTRIASTKPSRTLFYYRTRLGSVIATSLAGGVRGASYRYTPYGEVDRVTNETDATRSDLGYTNALRLTGSLLHLKNRVYDPETRLFIQADVVDRLRYAYVEGDPVNASDPTGLAAHYYLADGTAWYAAPPSGSTVKDQYVGGLGPNAGAWNSPQSGASQTESAGEAAQTALQLDQAEADARALVQAELEPIVAELHAKAQAMAAPAQPLPTPQVMPAAPVDADGKPLPPPVPLPPGRKGEANSWVPAKPSKTGDRAQKWKPKFPVANPKGSQPGASWDDEHQHWDVDWGRGPRDRERFLPDGTPVSHKSFECGSGCTALVGAGATVVTGGALYLIYRGVRLIPSFAPPLWPTLALNLALP